MPALKPEGWKDDLDALVAEGKTYAQTQAVLQEKYGEEGSVGASTFGKLKKLKFPEERREAAIAEVGDQHEQAAKSKKKLIKVDKKWTLQKQKAGDTSQLAQVLNQVIFHVIPCKTGKLEQKHIDEINVGGGVVNTISYAFPGLDFTNNPIITLVIRIALLVIKVRKICNKLRDKYAPTVIGAPEDGSNEDFGESEPNEATVKGMKLSDIFSEHPTDKFMKEEGLMEQEPPK